METIIDRVAGAAGRYEGTGDGVESGPFTAVIDVLPLLDGMGAELRYIATAPGGTTLHAEHTVLAFDMWSGEPTLHVLCAELNGMARLSLVGESRFANGLGVDGFELQIDLVVGDGTLDYVWSWGPPGEALVERSRASTRSIA